MNISKLIDQTVLKKDATEAEIKKVCEETKKYGFRALCVYPEHTKLAKEMLKNTEDDPLDHTELPDKAKHIRIMKTSAPGLLIKAAGSIRTLDDLKMMVEAGADIIGTSSGVEIVNEAKGKGVIESEEWRKIE